jgi:hypothetical protein
MDETVRPIFRDRSTCSTRPVIASVSRRSMVRERRRSSAPPQHARGRDTAIAEFTLRNHFAKLLNFLARIRVATTWQCWREVLRSFRRDGQVGRRIHPKSERVGREI